MRQPCCKNSIAVRARARRNPGDRNTLVRCAHSGQPGFLYKPTAIARNVLVPPANTIQGRINGGIPDATLHAHQPLNS